jgi:hypothetical protein
MPSMITQEWHQRIMSGDTICMNVAYIHQSISQAVCWLCGPTGRLSQVHVMLALAIGPSTITR